MALLPALSPGVPAAALARLRAEFDAVDAAALHGRSRLEIRRLAERSRSASASR